MRQYKTLSACLEALARDVVLDERDNRIPAHVVRQLEAYTFPSKAQEARLVRAGIVRRHTLRGCAATISMHYRYERGKADGIAWFCVRGY